MTARGLGNYLFIDGNYLRRAYEDTMRQLFPQADVNQRNIHFPEIKRLTNASKVFYYDAVDEDASDKDDRRAFLDHLNALDGFHIREGTLSRDKKRQKQVDVALAVECLTHAFNKNIWHVTLLAGDLDFKPLVDALINGGIHVHVMYEPKSGNRRLYRAADVGQPIRLIDFWGWSIEGGFNAKYPPPTVAMNDDNHQGTHLVKQGSWNGRTIQFWRNQDEGSFRMFAPREAHNPPFRVALSDAQRLEKYFELAYGSVEWTKTT
jgi:uncharacterized LabA/DUF88 family protein